MTLVSVWQRGNYPDVGGYADVEMDIPTFEVTITEADYTAAITAMMDATARERRYDSALSLSTYVGSENPTWAAEAQTFVAWRDAVWTYCYSELTKVQASERTQPTVTWFLTELPAIVWPA